MAATLPRITARVDENTQKLLTQAAALSGVSSINSFVLNAAIEKAKSIIELERVLKLSFNDCKTLMDALDKPALENQKLKSAFEAYQTKIDK